MYSLEHKTKNREGDGIRLGETRDYVHGYTAIRLYGYTGLYGYTATLLHGLNLSPMNTHFMFIASLYTAVEQLELADHIVISYHASCMRFAVTSRAVCMDFLGLKSFEFGRAIK